jgi:hypothetical protein
MNSNLPKPPPFNQTNFIPFMPEDINRKIYKDHLWFDMEKNQYVMIFYIGLTLLKHHV